MALAASFLAACGWGMAPVFVTIANVPVLVLTFDRLWLGAALAITATYVLRRRLTWRDLRASLLGGVLLCADMAMFFSAVKMTKVVNASIILAAQPILVVVAAHRLFGEQLKRRDLIVMAVAMLGVAAVIGKPNSSGGPRDLEGDFLAAGALLCWSAYWLVSKHVRASLDTLTYTTGVTLVAAIVMFPVVILSRQPLGHVAAREWLWILLLAVIPGAAHGLMNWAQPFVDASISSAIGTANPITAGLAAMLILHQPLSAIQITGGILALAALTLLASAHRGTALSAPTLTTLPESTDDGPAS
jgi:drug/metabolite transporter (DMT)-like permease